MYELLHHLDQRSKGNCVNLSEIILFQMSTAWIWMTTISTSLPVCSNSGSVTCRALSWPLNSTRSSWEPWVNSCLCPLPSVCCFSVQDRVSLRKCVCLNSVVFFCLFRSARQAGGDPRSVFGDRPAQQDTPQHTGAPHLPSGQVSDDLNQYEQCSLRQTACAWKKGFYKKIWIMSLSIRSKLQRFQGLS